MIDFLEHHAHQSRPSALDDVLIGTRRLRSEARYNDAMMRRALSSGNGVPRRRRPWRPGTADRAALELDPAGRRRAARPSGQRRDPRRVRASRTGHRRRQSRAWSADRSGRHRAAAHRVRQGRPSRGAPEGRRSFPLRPWKRGSRGPSGRARPVRDRARGLVRDSRAGVRRDSADGARHCGVGRDRDGPLRGSGRHACWRSRSPTRLSCSWASPTRRRFAIS